MSKKLKIRKSLLRRFRITKTGKVLFRGSHVRHLVSAKDKSQVRSQKGYHLLSPDKAKKVKQMLGGN